MNKHYNNFNFRRLTKDDINKLPMKSYTGNIKIISTEQEADQAVSEMRNESVLGFDTETRPVFKKGLHYLPALLQLAATNCVYLIHLKKTGLNSSLRDLLSSNSIKKAGVSISYDLKELKKIEFFEAGGFVELADYAKQIGIQNLGLRGLAAVLFGFRISKSASCSNWENFPLEKKQKIYAATDAWLGREIYLKLEELKNG